ncbi:MAG: TraB/GumN family protein [Massilia sp.]
MRTLILSTLLSITIAAPALAQTEAAPADSPVAPVAPATRAAANAATAATPATVAAEEAVSPAVDAVVVTGQRPGPGLWKVSKDDHVLWILGKYSPLPKQMSWRSAQAERILLESQELINPPEGGFSISVSGPVSAFKVLTMLPSLIGAKKNPDGATLAQVLPPELYARWLPLKKKYLGDDSDIERERPFFAAQHLFDTALDKTGLSKNDIVWSATNQLAKKNKIKITHTSVHVEVEEPKAALKDFKKSSLADQDCFAKTIERLETDVDAIRVRANAWAIGNLAVMEKLRYPDQAASCHKALLDSEALKKQPGIATIEQRQREKWLAAVEKALAANKSTFALMSVERLLDPKGYLADLQAKGYQVDKPD